MSLELVGSLVERYQHSLSDVSSRFCLIASIGEVTVGGTIYSVMSLVCWLCQLSSYEFICCLAPGKHFSVACLLILKLMAKLTSVYVC